MDGRRGIGYRHADTNERWVSLIEPVRLWWLGELDRYIGRPPLRSRSTAPMPNIGASSVPMPPLHETYPLA